MSSRDEVRFDERATKRAGGGTVTTGLLRRASTGAALPGLLWSRGPARGIAVLISPDGKAAMRGRVRCRIRSGSTVAGGRLRRPRDRRARAGRVAEPDSDIRPRPAGERAGTRGVHFRLQPAAACRTGAGRPDRDPLRAQPRGGERTRSPRRLGTRGRLGCRSAGAGRRPMWIAPCSISRASGSPGWTGSTRQISCPAQRNTATCPRCWRSRHPASCGSASRPMRRAAPLASSPARTARRAPRRSSRSRVGATY